MEPTDTYHDFHHPSDLFFLIYSGVYFSFCNYFLGERSIRYCQNFTFLGTSKCRLRFALNRLFVVESVRSRAVTHDSHFLVVVLVLITVSYWSTVVTPVMSYLKR